MQIFIICFVFILKETMKNSQSFIGHEIELQL